MKRYGLFLFLLLLITTANAQQKVIQLYNGAAPGSENWNWEEQFIDSSKNMFKTNIVYNVSKPTLTVFTPDPSVANGSAVVIAPGGGFHLLSINSEGIDVANWLVKKGVTCFVLKYRLVHSTTNDPIKDFMDMMNNNGIANDETTNVIGMAISDGREAIAYVRKHASEYNISPNKIGIIGFSAGGTVAASSVFDYTTDNKPDFVAPIYAYLPPQLLNDSVATDAPPMFLAAATDDQIGLNLSSVDLYKKWYASKHSVELHLYATGGHGFGMRVQHIPTDTWIDRFGDWLNLKGFLKK